MRCAKTMHCGRIESLRARKMPETLLKTERISFSDESLSVRIASDAVICNDKREIKKKKKEQNRATNQIGLSKAKNE